MQCAPSGAPGNAAGQPYLAHLKVSTTPVTTRSHLPFPPFPPFPALPAFQAHPPVLPFPPSPSVHSHRLLHGCRQFRCRERLLEQRRAQVVEAA